jgi:LysM repeat protein
MSVIFVEKYFWGGEIIMRKRRTLFLSVFMSLVLVTGIAYADGGDHSTHKKMNSSEYKVQKGDTLWGIAKDQLGDPYKWKKIYELNADNLSNPNEIYQGQTLKLPKQSEMNGGHHAHKEQVEVPAGAKVPTIKVNVIKDRMSGWNLNIQTTDFKFSAENVSGPNNPDHVEGHGHLYIDGKKVTRLYGPWYYLGELSPGTHEIKVYLNANNHARYVHDGQEISDTVTIQVQE